MQTLQIYNASAGSGKTFTLALEYIKLLVLSPQDYRSILAVTFTNKATAEMKERILSQLYGIAFSLPDSNGYFERVRDDLKIDENTVRRNCRTALHLILHDFSYFHVETIDSFFQMIIRNLAQELQLSGNINLDLDQRSAIDEAVDHLIEGLTPNSPTIQWILDYIFERIEDNQKWDISKNLKTFGENLFNETYQNHAQELAQQFNAGVYQGYKEKLKKEIEEQQKRLQDFGQAFMDSLKEKNICMDDFPNKSTSGAAYFQKLIDGKIKDKDLLTARALKFMEDPEEWAPKKSPKRQQLIELATTLWRPMMLNAEKARQEGILIINTNKCLRKHFNDLQLLSSIHDQLKLENNKHNRLLLAETPLLLNRLIQDSDAPFIFEKIGTQLKHIMIDEFQDTSRMQWNNFKSLLIECLSQGNDSLIVGDIKQSIYRWRNGDWSILKNIRDEVPTGNINSLTLKKNYRSCGNIIAFNNMFFQALTTYMSHKEEEAKIPPQIQDIYSDVVQEIKPENEGLGSVNITLIHEKDEARSGDYKEETISEIANTIQMLLEKGAALNDIAILLRKKLPIQEIASYFAHHLPHIPIVSAEAFLLNASEAVCTIIQALRFLNDQTDTLAAAQLAFVYQNKVLGKEITLNSICMQQDKTTLLPCDFVAQISTLKLLPLYELIQHLISLFQIQKLEKQEAYLFYFLDQVMEFLTQEPGDILSFLTYWEDTLQNKKIPAGKIQGVQIMSIHASKGLEFPHVIIPFCDWAITSKARDILWAETGLEQADELPVAPVEFGSDMENSIFRKQYQKELQQQWIDNINLLYVAFTRPKANLFIFGKQNARDSVSNLLFEVLRSPEDNTDSDFIYQTGSLFFPETAIKKDSQNPLLITPKETPVSFHSLLAQIEFRQSNKSRQFIESEEEGSNDNQEFIQQGLIMHSIFSSIHTAADVETILRKLEFEGVIGNNLTQQKIEKLVHNALNNPTAKDWFSDSWEVINECSILQQTPEGMKVLRPDRVMVRNGKVVVVDFKFGKEKAEYETQVRSYMSLLLRMGYEQVEGYLWYVYKNSIYPVKL